MAKELPKRSEVRLEDTWAIEDMYASLKEWEADIKKAQKMAEEVESKKDSMTKSAGELYETLNLNTECEKILYLAANYASRATDVDTKNTENQANWQRIMGIIVDISSKLAFIQPAVLELSQETLEQYMKEEPELELYRAWFKELQRTKDHTLSAEMEELLAATGEMQQTPEQIFSMFNDADIEFPEITDEEGEQVRITSGRFISMLNSKDRRVRKDAFLGLYGTYKKFENTLASIYSGQVKQLMFLAKARKYKSTLEAAVDANNVSPKVYDNLIEAVNENIDKMNRYVSLRKKCLGLSELHMYDISLLMKNEYSRDCL